MYPSFQRFQSTTARSLHGAGRDGDDNEEEDARDVVRSLQPLPSARLMGANAMVRELQARVGPQYVPSAAQQQQIQHFHLQQQQHFQQMQQQQRRGRGAPMQPMQYLNMEPSGWPPMSNMDGLSAVNMVATAGFSGGGGTDDMPVFDAGGRGSDPRASLNAQFLPPIMSKYRRESDTGGVQEQGHKDAQPRHHHLQQQQQHGQANGEQQEDQESERDRLFRMRAMYLQQQHLQERQKLEERQQQEEQKHLQQQQQQAHQQHQQRRQQAHFQQQQLPLTPQQQEDTRQHQRGRDAAPFSQVREPDFDLPRRIHRDFQPPPQLRGSVAPAAPVAAPRNVSSTASTSTATSGLSLPLPPPLPSTARRFGMAVASPQSTGLNEFANLEEPPAPIEPLSLVQQQQQQQQAVSNRATQQQIPRQQQVPPQHPQIPAVDPRMSSTEYYPSLNEEELQQQAQAGSYVIAGGSGRGGSSKASRAPARRSDTKNYDDDDDDIDDDEDLDSDIVQTRVPKRRKPAAKRKKSTKAQASAEAPAPFTEVEGSGELPVEAEPKRRCGRKSMNYSSEQKRERNRAAVKKCRQRQALKYDYLLRKAEVLETENRALSDLLVNNVDLDDDRRVSLTRGIQMDILFKIKEIFTQSLPKDFVLDADSIWDLNSVLAVSMPSRCYYGIESIKEFWRTSLRMRNKGKIRSFWAWLFRLPPGDRFTEFDIQPFSDESNLYFITWTTKSEPPLAGSMVIMFGHGHRVTLHVECFGWLIWRYLLTNEPFPEPLD